MHLPDLTHLTYRQRAERLADEAVRALRQDRLNDATALAAVASAHAAVANDQKMEDVVETPLGIPLSVTGNPRVRDVTTFLRQHASWPVSNAEVKKAFGYNDAEAGNALRDAASLGLAVKLGHGVWQAT
ncbi:hypothetical protein ACFVY1_43560 [Streptomyces sp. NPDC058293]|uniref:hypothetical protein n=1 Tax=unclassified Streptomyces TaxID=2593676 RepID=UPI0033A7B126